jgi:hypothetical protein
VQWQTRTLQGPAQQSHISTWDHNHTTGKALETGAAHTAEACDSAERGIWPGEHHGVDEAQFSVRCEEGVPCGRKWPGMGFQQGLQHRERLARCNDMRKALGRKVDMQGITRIGSSFKRYAGRIRG